MDTEEFRSNLTRLKLNKPDNEFEVDDITSYHRQIIANTAKVLKRKYTTWKEGDVFVVHRAR